MHTVELEPVTCFFFLVRRNFTYKKTLLWTWYFKLLEKFQVSNLKTLRLKKLGISDMI